MARLRRAFILLLSLAAIAAGCGPSVGPLPAPPDARASVPAAERAAQADFADFTERPVCSADVDAALADGRPGAIAAAARAGANFTCGRPGDPSPLDRAITSDRPDHVKALLDAGANPRARWSDHGDRLPLRSAIEAQLFGHGVLAHRAEIVHLLLEHGADPNARWCPYESRGPIPIPCTSAGGVTSLIMATALRQLDTVTQLLDAGADISARDWTDSNAVDYTSGQAIMAMLLVRLFPDNADRKRRALDYLEASAGRAPWSSWTETPLMHAIAGDAYPLAGFPPPPRGQEDTRLVDSSVERTRIVLGLGADPDQRIRRGTLDWTPLALALWRGEIRLVEVLLQYGADPNVRWCADLINRTPTVSCRLDTAPTPLMWAAGAGRPDVMALLLQYGADPAAHDDQGRTAADYAAGTQASALRRALKTQTMIRAR